MTEEISMAKLTLYHAAPSRSQVVRWMLEELGEPYDIHLLSLAKGEQSKPDYLAINPMGKVPALKHGDAILPRLPRSAPISPTSSLMPGSTSRSGIRAAGLT
jgi:hypothetical protein